MSTLAVVEEILRETSVPMSVREIVEHAGVRLPSKSKTPDTVVARDLSMDIKKKGEASLFVRSSPGRYTLRSIASLSPSIESSVAVSPDLRTQTTPMSALSQRKPAVAANPAPRARTDSEAQGGGLIG